MKEKKEVREIFIVEDDFECDYIESQRIAVIEFCNKEFIECKYVLPNKIYDYKDWLFIGEVSKRIQELKKELYNGYTQEEIERLIFRSNHADISRMLLFNLVREINWFKPKKKHSLKEINKIAIELEGASLEEKKAMYSKYLNKQWGD